MSLTALSATDLLAKLTSGEISSRELTQACLDRIAAVDDKVGAMLRVDAEAALQQADSVDRRRAAGQAVGLLGGLPVSVKDVLCQQGEKTTCASRMLTEFRPPYDSTVVAKLKAADAVLLGRTNMDEFAMGGSTENSAFQPTHNPWALDRSPGGSSGGSAACVAARMTPLSIGTDTGGSIRQPAALCGIVGMKPTYGRVSRFGLVAFASSLDQVGPMATTVEDTALLLDAIAGHDPRDSTSLDVTTPNFRNALQQPLQGLTLGVVPEHFGEGLDPEVATAVQNAIDVYKGLGATVKEVHLPHSKQGVATYYVIAPSEASSNLARYDGAHYGYRTPATEMLAELTAERKAAQEAGDTQLLEQLDSTLVRMYRKSRSEALGPEVKRRIMLGTYALSAGYYDAYYLKALSVRRLIRQDYDQAFQEVDLIIGPTTPGPAEPLGKFAGDPLGMYLLDLYTVSANLAGLPALSLPCGLTSGGLPIGLQLYAPALQEEKLLRAAMMYQQAKPDTVVAPAL